MIIKLLCRFYKNEMNTANDHVDSFNELIKRIIFSYISSCDKYKYLNAYIMPFYELKKRRI